MQLAVDRNDKSVAASPEIEVVATYTGQEGIED
jgi:hypothetical protein